MTIYFIISFIVKRSLVGYGNISHLIENVSQLLGAELNTLEEEYNIGVSICLKVTMHESFQVQNLLIQGHVII